MKTSSIVLIVVAVVSLFLIGVFVVKMLSNDKFCVLYEDEENIKFKLNLTEADLEDLTKLNEVTDFKDLSRLQQDYFCIIFELVMHELAYSADFSTNLRKLLNSMIDSSKEYISRIAKTNPVIVAHLTNLDDIQFFSHQKMVSDKLDSFISSSVNNYKKLFKEEKVKRNIWISLNYERMKNVSAAMNKIKPTKIELLPEDETFYNDCISCLLKFFDNRDKVIIENIEISDELIQKHRKLIKIFSRCLLIEYPIHLFLK